MAEKIIDLKVKSFKYADEEMLKNLELEVYEGEFILLTGLSGCGKTTLIRIINGLIPEHYEGKLDASIKILNKDINDYEKGELTKIMANVFQSPKDQFFSTMAEDEVALVGENLGMERDLLIKRVNEAFEILNISHLKNKSIFEMSGGEMQKVAIASSLVYDCKILILDEPSASLDYKSVLQLREILKKLKSMGKTIIIAEHRLFYLKGLFDRAHLLKDGEIYKTYSEDQLTPKELYENNLRTLDEKNLKASRDICRNEEKYYFSDLSVAIKKKTLIENLSFSIRDGECMGIIGKNGVGKTTLLKSIVGVRRLNARTNMPSTAKMRLKKAFMLLQDADNHIFFDTVENEILEKKRLSDNKYLEEVKERLKNADLWEKRLEHPQELSVGEKQRLVLLITYFYNKEIILLDEPSSGLDFKRMKFAEKIITQITKTRPVMLVTHDIELLFGTCNSVLMLDRNNSKKIDVMGNEEEILKFLANN